MWQIANLENTVKISKNCAKDLFKQSQKNFDDIWSDADEVLGEKNTIYFNSDHMEHTDFLWQEAYQNILCKYKVKGRITFGSLDGDNFGEFWGYEFDGKGKMKKIKGTLNWTISRK